MPVTVLLKALGYSEEKILREFYQFETFLLGKESDKGKYRLNMDFLKNEVFPFDIKTVRGAVIVSKGRRVKIFDLKKIEAQAMKEHPVPDSFMYQRRLAAAIIDQDGEVVGARQRGNYRSFVSQPARRRCDGIANHLYQ